MATTLATPVGATQIAFYEAARRKGVDFLLASSQQ